MSKKQRDNQDESMPNDESIKDADSKIRVAFKIFESPDDDSEIYNIDIPSSYEITKVVVDVYSRCFLEGSFEIRTIQSSIVKFE